MLLGIDGYNGFKTLGATVRRVGNNIRTAGNQLFNDSRALFECHRMLFFEEKDGPPFRSWKNKQNSIDVYENPSLRR
jgi:hypothetical protein